MSRQQLSKALLLPPAHASTESKRFSLRLLSPTTELDIGAADYDTVYPRLCSIEYLAPAATCVSMLLYGFTVLGSFCSTNYFYYQSGIVEANSFFQRMGSKGYDNGIDTQWTEFIANYKHFVAVALLLASFSRLYRALLSYLAAFPPSLPSDVTASSLTPRSKWAEGPDDDVKTWALTGWLGKLHSRVRALGSLSSAARRSTALMQCSWILPAFYSIVGVIFVAIVHGPHFFLPLLIAIANYVIFSRLQRWCPYRLFMAIMWVTHVSVLYTIEANEGFEQTYWLQYYFTSSASSAANVLGYAVQPLWRQRMRWYVAYRMTTLRLIAFNYDLWEATHAAAGARERARGRHNTTCVECAQLHEQNATSAAKLPEEASRCYKYRTEYVRDTTDYTFVNYTAYVLFPPLYLAGPMSSFNAFVSHMRVPSTSMPLRKMVMYAFGIFRLYIMEYTLLHFVHIPCLATYTFMIHRMSVLETAHFLFLMLSYLWLKFSLIWKSSRLFAMLSGIEVPEDMRRCFANTLTVRDFWRDWHASFNLWIVRYMYIPMGGRSRVALSVPPIFLFIAVWHDPALHLIKWAMCIAVIFVAELGVNACFGSVEAAFLREMAGTSPADATGGGASQGDSPINSAPRRGLLTCLARFSARRLSPRVRSCMHRQLRAVAGMCSVLGLIIANSVGFSMQNSEATVRKRGPPSASADADDVIAWAFRNLTPLFTLGLIAFLCSLSALAVMDRDMTRQHMSLLKLRYRLK
ncbi:hypothetical protein CUR178_06494 [Leishmania enriettii]|uniref:Glycerol uptake protein n=2 Tax=Leishmania enriettii TaxID=5663 RepID=A0A836GTX3_LEIEN|nr:hypothetical protein CUR178_06494 [Leishmania enriettii]